MRRLPATGSRSRDEMTDKSDFVIIGGVAAGPKTAATLARRLPGAAITLFQKEEHTSYATCGLPYFASGDINSFEELTLTGYAVPRTPSFFRRTKGFDVFTGAEVVRIDRRKTTVLVKMPATGETMEHGYGKLVIATGAVPARCPFPCADLPNVRHFTRPGDAQHFRRMAEQGKVGSAVVVGGGFIGCEVAEAAGGLWGIETTLVEREPQLLPYVLDPEMAALVQAEMQRQSVRVHTGTLVEEIQRGDDASATVKIRGADDVAADYVFLCLGVLPNAALAQACGLQIGETGGIVVNEKMQTSDPDIYAGGDCVESTNRLTGGKCFVPMGSLANRHGRVIAENLAGNDVTYAGTLGAFMVKVFDYNVGAVGLSETVASRLGMETRAVWASFPDKPDYYPEVATLVAKMVYEPGGGRLLGLQAVGKGEVCRRVDVFSGFLQRQAVVEDLLDFEHGYAPPYAEALDPLHHLAALAQAQCRGIEIIGPGEACPANEELSGDNVIWLDVREPQEVDQERNPYLYGSSRRALAIPLDDLRDHLNELDRSKTIMLICRRGPRSYQAAVILRSAGFEKVRVIGGGTTAGV